MDFAKKPKRKRKTAPKTTERKPKPSKAPAFISGGLGDFIAIESFLSDKEIDSVSEFFLFTRAAASIEKVIRTHRVWKDLKVTIPYSPSQIRGFKTYSFFKIPSVQRLSGASHPELRGAMDWAGDFIYPDVLKGVRKYKARDNWAIEPVANQCVIDPASNADDRLVKQGRNLTQFETAIIRGQFPNAVEVGEAKTSLLAALALVRGAEHFRGIDSAMSVFAARQESIQSIKVRTVNPIYRKWKPIYDPLDRIEIVPASKWAR